MKYPKMEFFYDHFEIYVLKFKRNRNEHKNVLINISQELSACQKFFLILTRE